NGSRGLADAAFLICDGDYSPQPSPPLNSGREFNRAANECARCFTWNIPRRAAIARICSTWNKLAPILALQAFVCGLPDRILLFIVPGIGACTQCQPG